MSGEFIYIFGAISTVLLLAVGCGWMSRHDVIDGDDYFIFALVILFFGVFWFMLLPVALAVGAIMLVISLVKGDIKLPFKFPKIEIKTDA